MECQEYPDFKEDYAVGQSSAHISEIFFSFRHRELYFGTLGIPTIAQTMRLLFSKEQIYGFQPLPPTSTWKLAASAQIQRQGWVGSGRRIVENMQRNPQCDLTQRPLKILPDSFKSTFHAFQVMKCTNPQKIPRITKNFIFSRFSTPRAQESDGSEGISGLCLFLSGHRVSFPTFQSPSFLFIKWDELHLHRAAVRIT